MDNSEVRSSVIIGLTIIGRAIGHYRDSLELTLDHGDRRLLAEVVSNVERVVADRGEAERTGRLTRGAATLSNQIGTSIPSWDLPSCELGEAMIRSSLSPEVSATAWDAGVKKLTVSELVAEAIADLDHVSSPSPPNEPAHRAGLTPREDEILRLLADGRSDREIAALLAISSRTVSGHVSNLLGKLGVESRTAAVAHALRSGLA